MLLEELAHVALAKGNRDAVDASFDTRTEVICLQSILRSKVSSSLGDCGLVSTVYAQESVLSHALSSWRLSINACFWFCVRRSFLAGLPVGVASGASSNPGDFRFRVVMVEGGGELSRVCKR